MKLWCICIFFFRFFITWVQLFFPVVHYHFFLRMCRAERETFESFLLQVYLIAVNCLCPLRQHCRQFYDAFGRLRFRGTSAPISQQWNGEGRWLLFLFSNLIQEGRFRAFFALLYVYYLRFYSPSIEFEHKLEFPVTSCVLYQFEQLFSQLFFIQLGYINT